MQLMTEAINSDLPPIDLRTIKNVNEVNQTPATKVHH